MVISSVKIDNRPLERKIIRWSTLVLGTILLIFCITSLIIVQIRFTEEQDEHLREEANFILKAVSVRNDQLVLDPELEWEEQHHMEKSDDPIKIVIFDINKTVFYNTKGMDDTEFANDFLTQTSQPEAAKSIINIYNRKIRFIVAPIIKDNNNYGWLVTSMFVDRLNSATKMLITVYLIIFPFSLLITYLGSAITAKTAVKPIQQISDAAETYIKKSDKSVPVPQTKDELHI